jgi:hypothetical protein
VITIAETRERLLGPRDIELVRFKTPLPNVLAYAAQFTEEVGWPVVAEFIGAMHGFGRLTVTRKRR